MASYHRRGNEVALIDVQVRLTFEFILHINVAGSEISKYVNIQLLLKLDKTITYALAEYELSFSSSYWPISCPARVHVLNTSCQCDADRT